MKCATLTATSSLALPRDSYIYSIVSVDRNAYIAAISSDDSLRIIDPSTLKEISNGIIPNVHGGVTCLVANKDDPHCILTAGRDGLVRCWDLRSANSTLEFRDGPSLGDSLGQQIPGKAFATVCGKPQRRRHRGMIDRVLLVNSISNSHWVQSHPGSPQTLLSGSTDGLVNIYDTTRPDEEDALIQVSNHSSSISHASFLSHTQFYALSHDENLSIYQLNKPDGSLVEDFSQNVKGDLRTPLQCEYVVDCIPCFGSGQAILGAGSHSKNQLDLIPIVSAGSEVWTYDVANTVRLSGAHGEEIIRSMFFDHQAQAIFTAGEDGCVKAWRAGDDAMLGADLETPRRKKKKESADDGEGKRRFRPY